MTEQDGTQGTATLYFGGVPTEPDIKRIRDKWPDTDLQLGQEIACEDVAAEINVDVDGNRFKTVTTRWRKLVEKGPAGFVVGRRRGMFVILRDGEIVNSNEADLRSAVRKTRRAAIRSTKVDVLNLSEDELKRHDIHQGLTTKLLLAANVRKNVAALPKME